MCSREGLKRLSLFSCSYSAPFDSPSRPLFSPSRPSPASASMSSFYERRASRLLGHLSPALDLALTVRPCATSTSDPGGSCYQGTRKSRPNTPIMLLSNHCGCLRARGRRRGRTRSHPIPRGAARERPLFAAPRPPPPFAVDDAKAAIKAGHVPHWAAGTVAAVDHLPLLRALAAAHLLRRLITRYNRIRPETAAYGLHVAY